MEYINFLSSKWWSVVSSVSGFWYM